MVVKEISIDLNKLTVEKYFDEPNGYYHRHAILSYDKRHYTANEMLDELHKDIQKMDKYITGWKTMKSKLIYKCDMKTGEITSV